MSTTLLSCTDSTLPEAFASLMRRWLVWAAEGRPIVAVAQQPIPEWPDTIVVGPMGRSHLSLCRQIVAGLQAVTTDTVAFTEHDCLYTPEHLAFEPPDRGLFYFNTNHWFLQWSGPQRGEFSWRFRHALSNMVADRDLALAAFAEKLYMAEHDEVLEDLATDTVTVTDLRRATQSEPGMRDHLPAYQMAADRFALVGYAIHAYRKTRFKTRLPNVDIRHGGNWTGGRTGHLQRRTLHPWGDLETIRRGPP